MRTSPTLEAGNTFATLAAIAKRESGLQLLPEKRVMVQSRLKPRLRALNLPDFETYVSHLASGGGEAEIGNMISALTTNVTHFFREQHHFDILFDQLGEMIQRKIENGERVRIWSAGCSLGQEPYSIAMYLLLRIPELAGADFRILATDIDAPVIASARMGRYPKSEVTSFPTNVANTNWVDHGSGEQIEISCSIKKYVTFRELNLIHSWPMTGVFDAIFCRNVVIYFDTETQKNLWPRFAKILSPRGLLFLGHSERISQPEKYGLKNAGTTCYTHVPNHIQRDI